MRALTIKLAAAEGGGTALRADAQVVWTPPVAPREHIPSGVRSVLVNARDPEHHVSFKRVVRDRATVRRLVALVEHTKLAPPLIGNERLCPLDTGRASVVALSFRGRAHQRPLARLKINENGCSYVELRVHGQGERELQGAFETAGKLEKVLDHRL